ncbi:hypothetical protein WR25_11525 isoform C [Diploscapter pachys]|uniref:receptor protein serine/threonine kinase n=1 Tax=Diploscapter pachys TaxID=2018661 RepID=A0A2A2JKJ3_9BILA|nr:hypothetical protein WR25_11525 isoform A [Diploscapter pachys]PAV62068.1 hypothetical protein WR25_11525 isoform B [Diploscapter pachys]PAV62069.1 hypothetical protein WR25_11525 isoform C [Diploscapter pachys]
MSLGLGKKILAIFLQDTEFRSGSGKTALNQRTVANDLKIITVIGQGRFGQVRKAFYRCSYVAVKTFYTTEENSWRNELDIYQTHMLNHENILQYVAADISSEDSITQMLLITDYHSLGSLFDYLRRDDVRLGIEEALRLCHSSICGIEHLHAPIQGTGSRRKPEIAHRDIKSKNIIVKRPGVCCIADFGLAVRLENNRLIPEKVNAQVGTKRYMAPEVLCRMLNVNDFTQFKLADMYSFALVLWEIMMMIELKPASGGQEGVDGNVSESSGLGDSLGSEQPRIHRENASINKEKKASVYMPYEGMVSNDPSFEEMRRVICEEEKRPPIDSAWITDNQSCLNELTNLMSDCWHANPDARHTALRVKKQLLKMIEGLQEVKVNGKGKETTSRSQETDSGFKETNT